MHVGAVDRGGVRPGGGEFADGDGGRVRWPRWPIGRNDPGFIPTTARWPVGGVCAGSDLMHPLGALTTGADCRRAVRVDVHGDAEQVEDRRRAGGVAAARPVRRVGRHCRRHFWRQGARRIGGVSLAAQVIGHAGRRGPLPCWAAGGVWRLEVVVGLRLIAEAEFKRSDLSIHIGVGDRRTRDLTGKLPSFAGFSWSCPAGICGARCAVVRAAESTCTTSGCCLVYCSSSRCA